MKLWIDTETYSPVPISRGVYAYAERADILLIGWAIDSAPAQVHDYTHSRRLPDALQQALLNERCNMWAHDAQFDRVILERHLTQYPIALARWRCTAAQARAHGLPGGLAALADALECDVTKDAAGRALIELFCAPDKCGNVRADRTTHPEEWRAFKAYCAQDVETMRKCNHRIPRDDNYPDNPDELDIWRHNQLANDRGIALDARLIDAAIVAVDAATSIANVDASKLTHGTLKTLGQRGRILRILSVAYGVDLVDLRAGTVTDALRSQLPDIVAQLLTLRAENAKASTAKYARARKVMSADGRLRGAITYCGAARTGRFSAAGVQPQNMPRQTHDAAAIEDRINKLKLGCTPASSVMRDASECVRGMLVASPGKTLLIADYSSIEARVLAWFAGDTDLLTVHAANKDVYRHTYATAFRVHVDDVTAAQRQIGKVLVLAMGYGGSVGALVSIALLLGMDLPALARCEMTPPAVVERARVAWVRAVSQKRTYRLEESVWTGCCALVLLWRAANPLIVNLWYTLEEAMKKATLMQQASNVGEHIWVGAGDRHVHVRLPSGRLLCYWNPRIDTRGTIMFHGAGKSRKMEQHTTYGGKLVENVVQATARDVMAHHFAGIERAGIHVLLSSHDEPICEAPLGTDPDTLVQAMISPLDWAPGLPLHARGHATLRYGQHA